MHTWLCPTAFYGQVRLTTKKIRYGTGISTWLSWRLNCHSELSSKLLGKLQSAVSNIYMQTKFRILHRQGAVKKVSLVTDVILNQPAIFVHSKCLHRNLHFLKWQLLCYYVGCLLAYLVKDCTWLLPTIIISQQCSAPAYAAHIMQEWLPANCPDFTAKDQWPPNLPDLNPCTTMSGKGQW